MVSRAPTLNVPQETTTRAGGGYTKRPAAERLYAPLPKGLQAKSIGINRLFFSTFLLNSWALFTAPADHPFLNSGIVNPDNQLWTYYLKVGGHFIEIPGEKFAQRYYVACPRMMNAYFTKVLGLQPLFKSSECACCDSTKPLWEAYDEAWKYAKGIGGHHPGDRKDIKLDDLKVILALNPLLGQIKKRLDDMRVVERYLFQVYDLDKAEGRRQLDEGEDAATLQLWMAPKAIYDALFGADQSKIAFYDTDHPRPFQVQKDCTKGVFNAKYTVTIQDEIPFPDDVKAYLEDPSNLPDLRIGPIDGDNDYVLTSNEDLRELMKISFPDFLPDNIEAAMLGGATAPSAPVAPAPSAPKPPAAPTAPKPAPKAPTLPADVGPAPAPAPAPAPGAAKKSRW